MQKNFYLLVFLKNNNLDIHRHQLVLHQKNGRILKIKILKLIIKHYQLILVIMKLRKLYKDNLFHNIIKLKENIVIKMINKKVIKNKSKK
jgi:hypothetical protein